MLENIELHNFKSARKLGVKLSPLTVLTGLNGSGKSTVLQSIALLKQSLRGGVASQELRLQGELVRLGRSEDVRFEDAAEDEIGFVVRTTNGVIKLFCPTIPGVDSLKLRSDGDTDDLISQLESGFQFIQADRITPAGYYQQASTPDRATGWLGCRGEYTVDYLIQKQDQKVSPGRHFSRDQFDSLASLLEQVAPTDSLLDQTTGWLQSLSPGVRPRTVAVDLADAASLRFSYTGTAVDSDGRDHRPSNVGFGLTYCLPIIVACLTAPAGALLLLENPEAHLHPRGQAALGLLLALCAADGVQILVETHSDHVLNGIRVAVKCVDRVHADDISLHYFTRDINTGESSIESPCVLPDGQLDRWPDGFFDQWDRSLDALLD